MGKSKTATTTAGLTAFRNQWDSKTKAVNAIRTTFTTMLKDHPESYLEENELAERAKISKDEMRAVREDFDKHIVEVKKRGRSTPIRIWFADPKVATEARKPA